MGLGGGKAPEVPEVEEKDETAEGIRTARDTLTKEKSRVGRKQLTVPLGGTLGSGTALGIK